jgi:hypothetical protein
MPDGMTYQPPRSHGAPCPRLMARAVALRSDAAEVAYHLGQCPNWQREKGAAMIANHQALMLRALAAEHMARGEQVLARSYVATARRVEAGR